ncbi:helix-turn-helix domain-containing protein [Amphritea opalescens]|uniref:Helix-turn-helix domain-containing protein n=1 Tax=Amphritea opalescens TaxID=2490544 RepID=A0A430KTC0_9GAMM|nr:helix-turn-helix domain-containing protein [Amphritea opalescens]RTE66761.1 helix-turn-helix domain-containing protein [Amphritea opalescens]
MKTINVVILLYPGVMRSAVEGLRELFELAGRLSQAQQGSLQFSVRLLEHTEVQRVDGGLPGEDDRPQVVILPPCLTDQFYTIEQPQLSGWLREMHGAGALLCSVCAGAFVLAQTGLLNQRPATTHWLLTERLAQQYSEVRVDGNKILINDGDLITAGGLMAWLDLGLELVAQFGSPALMRRLGKQLVIDTAPREQRYYRCFLPPFDHGDRVILKVQHFLQNGFQQPLTIKQLAVDSHLTERTFLRRFVRATGYKPKEYLQQLRISKACEALEATTDPVEQISLSVGYEDASAFRKAFIQIMGLTPREFRARFSH